MASRPCHPPLRQPEDGSASGNTHQNVLSIGQTLNALCVFGISLLTSILIRWTGEAVRVEVRVKPSFE